MDLPSLPPEHKKFLLKDAKQILSGVFQVTVLGTFMFLLYSNDNDTNTASSIHLFADDYMK